MQAQTKDRLKVEALEHGQAILMLIAGVAVAIGVDALFGHDREMPVMAVVIVVGVAGSMAVGALLNVLFAGLRGRLYEAVEADPSAELAD